MWPRFGIKIGNSTLCIAYVKADGTAEVIANKQGDRVSHACVLWNGGNDIECGLTAKQKLATKPKQSVAHSFQLLVPTEELDEQKLESAIKDIPCDYDTDSNTFVLKCDVSQNGDSGEGVETRFLKPIDVHVLLLKSELELARQYYNDATQKPIVVLSIPSYYPNTAWPLLAQAAESAGFHVAQLITESTAAVVAYGIGEAETKKAKELSKNTTSTVPKISNGHVLTIKSGGLWSHFALYAVRDGLYTQLESFGPFSIGGKRYDEALVQFICDEFHRKYKLDPRESRRSMAKIRTAAANCKHILTQLPATQVYIDSLMDGIDFNMQMSRARFESLIQPVINEFIGTLNQSVECALKQNETIERIDAIVLLGATTEIPKLQSAMESHFPNTQIYSTLPSNEVVAIGCARQANFLVNPEGNVQLSAAESCVCIEEDLKIWHGQDEFNAKLIIGKGALLPQTVHLDVAPCTTSSKDTKTFRMRVGEGGEIYETNLDDAAPAEDGFFHIEARIEDTEDESLAPLIRLRCL